MSTFILKIDKLFGLYNYTIELNDSYRFLTGLNGSGKTTILKIIQAIAERNLFFFVKLEFHHIEFKDQNNFYILIEKTEKEILLKNISKDIIWKANILSLRKIIIQEIARKGYYENLNLNNDELIENRFLSSIYNINEDSSLYKNDIIREWLTKFSKIKYNVYLISEQRLLKAENNQDDIRRRIYNNIDYIENRRNFYQNESILIYSEKLKMMLSNIVSRNALITNELDRTFPERLLDSTKAGKRITEQSFKEKLEKIQEIQKKIAKYFNIKSDKIIEQINLQHFVFNKETAATLYVYIDDIQKKLKGYNEIIEKLDIFVNAINKKNFLAKEIIISLQDGISFKGRDGNTISLLDLSSGEKQEIILLYDLLFNMPERSILLIDEPEISLHVAWAKEFMDDMEKILTLKKCQALIATHSPFIIGEHWNHAIDLTVMGTSMR